MIFPHAATFIRMDRCHRMVKCKANVQMQAVAGHGQSRVKKTWKIGKKHFDQSDHSLVISYL